MVTLRRRNADDAGTTRFLGRPHPCALTLRVTRWLPTRIGPGMDDVPGHLSGFCRRRQWLERTGPDTDVVAQIVRAQAGRCVYRRKRPLPARTADSGGVSTRYAHHLLRWSRLPWFLRSRVLMLPWMGA